MDITSFSNCFEQLSLAWQFASISSPAGVSLNTSNQDHDEKMIRIRPQIVLFNVLNDKSVAGLIGYQLTYHGHILFMSITPGLPLLCFRSMQFLKTIFRKVVGPIATPSSCGGICKDLFIANCLPNATVQKFKQSVNIW